jgi:hypothetical protein
MTPTIPFSGGCYCGNIRYECTAEPIAMVKCHCRDCQHVSGGPFVAAVVVPASAFKLTKGELRYHFTKSIAKVRHKRGFCPECGSRLTGAEFDGPSEIVALLAGSLDDPSWFSSSMDLFVADAQPWDLMSPDSPKFARYSQA